MYVLYLVQQKLAKKLTLSNNSSMRLRKLWPEFGVISICLMFLAMPYASAETSQSSNYKLNETSIGTSDAVGVQSATYGLTSGTGDLGVGNSASPNYQINAGSKTSEDPVLSFSVDAVGADFGTFSTTQASTTTINFTVKDYTTFGYIVQIFGDGPTNGTHTLAHLTAPDVSQVGVEQYGINLVANTSPVSLGANLDNGDFGNGSVASGYDVANHYQYFDGDVIASAPGDSGETTYTVSFLANVSPLTPGGVYNISQTLLVTATY